MKWNIFSGLSIICAAAALFSADAIGGDTTDSKITTSGTNEEPTPLDLFSLESTYTAKSTVRQSHPLGKQDSVYTDFDYSHRFHVTGQWYLRLGVEYQRYDFGGSPFPLPDHLQGASATIAYEYVVQGFAGAAIELHPGFYFQNNVSGKNFDVPIDLYTAFKIKDDKVFGMIGLFEGQMFSPSVIPIGGIIWLVNDKLRLEAIFPRPALIYTLNDDWEFRVLGEAGGYGFRMDKNRANPYGGSVVQYSYYELGAQATYSHWKPFDVSIGAGYDFQREFDFFRDGPGQKYKTAGAPYIRVSVEAKF